MEKRKACTVLALCASFVFSVIYFMIFGTLENSETSKVISISEEKEEDNYEEHNYLSWIQLGVFKEKSSYEELIKQCENLGLDPFLVALDDKVAVVAACRENRNETEELLKTIQEKQMEHILKESWFTDEDAQKMIAQKEYQGVLEGYVYQ